MTIHLTVGKVHREPVDCADPKNRAILIAVLARQ